MQSSSVSFSLSYIISSATFGKDKITHFTPLKFRKEDTVRFWSVLIVPLEFCLEDFWYSLHSRNNGRHIFSSASRGGWGCLSVFLICCLLTETHSVTLLKQTCREFHRITKTNLIGSFLSSLEKYTPALLKLYRSKGGACWIRDDGNPCSSRRPGYLFAYGRFMTFLVPAFHFAAIHIGLSFWCVNPFD